MQQKEHGAGLPIAVRYEPSDSHFGLRLTVPGAQPNRCFFTAPHVLFLRRLGEESGEVQTSENLDGYSVRSLETSVVVREL